MGTPTKLAVSTRTMVDAVASYVKRSRKKVTILFTDIQDSTKYWEKHGDLQGRLMVDLHNRLAFPVVRKFGGRVIKTIGDSIMASFKDPVAAVKAAMGIQQILAKAREADKAFVLHVRIGVHTGLALVEKDDVFGDVVNTAARVESQATGDQILVSEGTAQEVDDYDFSLSRAGVFQPKGKSRSITVFECPWQQFESFVDDIRPGSYLPVLRRQRLGIALHLISGFALIYFLIQRYLRFVAADQETFVLMALNPTAVVREHRLALAIAGVLVLMGVLVLWRVQAAPLYVLKLGSGMFGYALAFLGGWLMFVHFFPDFLPRAEQVIYASRHGFVEVQPGGAIARKKPHGTASPIIAFGPGTLLLQSDIARTGDIMWDKVLLGPSSWGWIARKEPARLGVPERQVTNFEDFRFCGRDVYALGFGLIGFVFGLLGFRIRPL